MSRNLRMTTWEQALAEVAVLERAGGAHMRGSWTLAQVLVHCAQSIEYSLEGYPRLYLALFRETAGCLVKRQFISRGYMTHRLDAPIPGAPALEASSLTAAIGRLRKAIARFQAADEASLTPHFAYGRCTKGEYEALQVMHLANHLSEVYPLAPRRVA
jgi:hypothetical protein